MENISNLVSIVVFCLGGISFCSISELHFLADIHFSYSSYIWDLNGVYIFFLHILEVTYTSFFLLSVSKFSLLTDMAYLALFFLLHSLHESPFLAGNNIFCFARGTSVSLSRNHQRLIDSFQSLSGISRTAENVPLLSLTLEHIAGTLVK